MFLNILNKYLSSFVFSFLFSENFMLKSIGKSEDIYLLDIQFIIFNVFWHSEALVQSRQDYSFIFSPTTELIAIWWN